MSSNRRSLIAAIVLATGALVLASSSPLRAADAKPDTRLFELRTYHTNPGKLDALHARFRDHTIKLFEKHGMTNVAYWVPSENKDGILVYLMAYPNREERDRMWKAFMDDPDWKAAYAESTKDGKLVAKVESLFLEPTGYSPLPEIARKDPARLFEMRTYTTNDGKLPNLDARFRDHTIKLFGKHGMTNVAYFHLAEGQEKADNTLVYFLAHKDKDARDASFAEFGKDPDWQAARKASEEDGRILVDGGVQSVLLEPTDYSPMR